MESPENFLTNVLKSDAISQIHYAVYKATESTTSTISATSVLRASERQLRHEEKYVLFDVKEAEIWVFRPHFVDEKDTQPSQPQDDRFGSGDWSLAGAGALEVVTKATYNIAHSHDDLISNTGAHLSSSATSSAVATPSTPAPPLFSTKNSSTPIEPQRDARMLQVAAQQRSNISFSGLGSPVDTFPNLSISESLEGIQTIQDHEERDPHMVRTKFLEAVMITLTFRLVTNRGWLPLNFNTFIYNGTTPGLPTVTSLDVQLTSSGLLLVTPKTRVEAALVNMKTDPETEAGESVWLAPGGTLGAFVGLEHDENPMWNSWKVHAQAWFSNKGLVLNVSEAWAKAKVWSESDGFVEILWPTKFIFFRRKLEGTMSKSTADIGLLDIKQDDNVSTFQNIFNLSKNPYLTSSAVSYGLTTTGDAGLTWFAIGDSLDFAQKWLGDKQTRDKEVNRIRNISKESPEVFNKLQPSGDSQTLSREITNGVVGGVYPTPPDGHQGSHETPAGPSSVATPSVKGGVEFAINVAGPPTAPATAEATNNTNTGDMEVDDAWLNNGDKKEDTTTSTEMFGNLSSMGVNFDDLNDELFGGGEVTEADFGFFDDDEAGGDFDMMMGGNTSNLAMGTVNDASLQRITENANVTTSATSNNASNFNFGFDSAGMNMFQQDRLLDDDMDLDLEDITAEMDQHVNTTNSVMVVHENNDTSEQTSLPSQVDHQQLNTQQLDSIGVKLLDSEELSQVVNMVIVQPQIQTPPLSPHRALKLLLPPKSTAPLKASAGPGMRRLSLYSPVNFPSFVENSDKKYMEGGRFYSSPEEQKKENKTALAGRTAPKPLSRRRPSRNMKIKPRQVIFLDDEDDDIEMASSDTDDSSASSDADESSEDETEDDRGFEYDFDDKSIKLADSSTPGSFVPGKKRKRMSGSWDGELENSVNMGSSPGVTRHRRLTFGQPTPEENESLYDRSLGLPPPPWDLCEPNVLDYPLEGIFTSKIDLRNPGLQIYADDLQAVYNIFLEQVTWSVTISGVRSVRAAKRYVSSLLDLDSAQGMLDDAGEYAFERRRCAMDRDLEDVTRDILALPMSRCTLDAYLHAKGADTDSGKEGLIIPHGQVGTHGGKSRISNDTIAQSSNTPAIFKIPPAYVHVHRNIASGDAPIEILPPALQFWETFALAPHSGTKNVVALCLYPAASGLKASMEIFLDRLGAMYEGCRLGSFTRAKLKHEEDGLVGVGPESVDLDGSLEDVLASYNESFLKIGRQLVSELTDELQNVVIFVINPFSLPSAVVNLCASFYEAQKAYVSGVQMLKMSSPNNLVLQIVPVDMVASKDGILAPNQGYFMKSALEVYNRCTPTESSNFGATFPQESYASSIVLAKPPPKSIDFKLTSDPSPAILQENKCLHVAYSQSIDERWICVSWSDNWGEVRAIRSYCLGRRGTNRLRIFEDVCAEIWNDTENIILKKKVHWRLLFVKAGVVEMDELDIWMKFSANTSVSNTLTVLSANVSPPLSLTTVLPPLHPQAFNQAQSYGTPVPATPQPSQASPDQYGVGPSTPNNEATPELDAETALIDYADEVWGVVLGHCLPNTANMVEIVPTLASGYLIKRGGSSEGEDPVVMSLSLIYTTCLGGGSSTSSSNSTGKPYEVLLREVLAQYRGLITLGQHFGVIDPVQDVLPWHVAAAVKGQEAFAACL